MQQHLDLRREKFFDALDDMDFGSEKEDVKKWYDGFTFGQVSDIYNPWSIINYLGEKNWELTGPIPAATVWLEN